MSSRPRRWSCVRSPERFASSERSIASSRNFISTDASNQFGKPCLEHGGKRERVGDFALRNHGLDFIRGDVAETGDALAQLHLSGRRDGREIERRSAAHQRGRAMHEPKRRQRLGLRADLLTQFVARGLLRGTSCVDGAPRYFPVPAPGWMPKVTDQDQFVLVKRKHRRAGNDVAGKHAVMNATVPVRKYHGVSYQSQIGVFIIQAGRCPLARPLVLLITFGNFRLDRRYFRRLDRDADAVRRTIENGGTLVAQREIGGDPLI